MATFFTDEDVPVRLVRVLDSMGIRATSVRDESRRVHDDPRMLGLDDEAQLAYAAERDWTMLVHNTRDYRRLHQEWLATGRAHAGIVAFDRPPGLTPETIASRLADLLAMPDLTLANAFWRWRGNNQWRQYPEDKG